MSLQGWQADVFSQASGLSSCHCAFLKAVHVIGLVSLCCCKVVGLFLLARLSASLLLIVLLLKAVHVIGLVLYVVARVLDLCLLGRPSA